MMDCGTCVALPFCMGEVTWTPGCCALRGGGGSCHGYGSRRLMRRLSTPSLSTPLCSTINAVSRTHEGALACPMIWSSGDQSGVVAVAHGRNGPGHCLFSSAANGAGVSYPGAECGRSWLSSPANPSSGKRDPFRGKIDVQTRTHFWRWSDGGPAAPAS